MGDQQWWDANQTPGNGKSTQARPESSPWARDRMWGGAGLTGRASVCVSPKAPGEVVRWPGDRSHQLGEETQFSNVQVWGAAALGERNRNPGNETQAGRTMTSAGSEVEGSIPTGISRKWLKTGNYTQLRETGFHIRFRSRSQIYCI